MHKVADVHGRLLDAIRGGVTHAILRDAEALLSSSGASLSALLEQSVGEGIELALTELSERYAEAVLGAGKSARTSTRTGHRSGQRTKTYVTKLGPLEVSFVKSRNGLLVPPFLRDAKRFADEMVGLARELWVRGLSTREIAKVAPEALGGDVSHTTVASWVRDVADEVLRWLNRPVRQDIAYLVADAIYVPVVRETSKKEPVLVVLGITEGGEKEILDVLAATAESLDSWTCILARLRARGLDTCPLKLAIADGDAGLISALEAELPEVPRQRCVVHKVRNVIGKCPRQLKKTAPREASAIWKAPNKTEARRRAKEFTEKYRSSHPQLAAIIEDDFEATLTFYDFDASRWEALRTNNVLERVNRELKRKFRDVGALDGDIAATRVAVTVAMMLNRDWVGTTIEGFKERPRGRKKTNAL